LKKIIVCVGSVWMENDLAGQKVYEHFQTLALPPDIEVYQGGLAGLNLLPLLEHGGRVVFVDSVKGFASPREVVIMDREQIVKKRGQHYGHQAGLPYLLAVLPLVNPGTMPHEIVLVGIEGPVSREAIEKAARLSLQIATGGLLSPE